jgi:hypothetical protein
MVVCFFFNQQRDDTRAKSISHVSYVCLVCLNESRRLRKSRELRAGNLRCVRSLTARRWRRRLRNTKRKTPFRFASRTHTTEFCFARQIHYMKVSLSLCWKGGGFEFRNTGKGSTLGGSRKTHTPKLCTCEGKSLEFYSCRGVAPTVEECFICTRCSQKVVIFYS